MKPCCDCVHFVAPVDGRDARCARFGKEFVVRVDVVYGPERSYSGPDCRAARGEGGQCGPSGRSFSAKKGTPTWLDEWAKQEIAVQESRSERPRKAPSWWKFW